MYPLNSIPVSLLAIIYATDFMRQILLSVCCLQDAGTAQKEENYCSFQANSYWMKELPVLCMPARWNIHHSPVPWGATLEVHQGIRSYWLPLSLDAGSLWCQMGWLLCPALAEVGMLVVPLAASHQLLTAGVSIPRSLHAATNFYASLIHILKLPLL